VHVVVKKAKSARFDEILMRDFCVGLNLNKIIRDAPFFVRTIGCFEHKNQFQITTEFVAGDTLKYVIRSKEFTFTSFLNIVLQILLGLEYAQNKLNFSHYDLHTDNVLVVRDSKPFTVTLYGYDYTIRHPLKPIMIDFGLSSVCSKGQTLGQKSLETKGIYDHLSPGYDIYIFLLFCLDVAYSTNADVFKGITELLQFFKTELGISMELLTNNHIKSLEKGVANLIPYKFLRYIVQRYETQLDVVVRPKRYEDRYIRHQPMFLKLNRVFGITDEFGIAPGNNASKGLVKTLVNDIKTYYWFNNKIVWRKDTLDRLLEVDRLKLQSLLDDLNVRIFKKGQDAPTITVRQKNLFFAALDYYYVIFDLELHRQHKFYKTWTSKFKETFVFKNLFLQLEDLLVEERLSRCVR
jgi:hypothetical protein